MIYCPSCKIDVRPETTIGANMRTESVCPACDHTLDAPQVPAATPRMTPAKTKPVLAQSEPQYVMHANLPKMVRERKKHLKAEIRRMQRELAALDRLGVKREPRRATVTPLRRGGTS